MLVIITALYIVLMIIFGIKNQNKYLVEFHKMIIVYIFVGSLLSVVFVSGLVDIGSDTEDNYIHMHAILFLLLILFQSKKSKVCENFKKFSPKYIGYGIILYLFTFILVTFIRVFQDNIIERKYIKCIIVSENDPLKLIYIYVVMCILAPIVEEIIFRMLLIEGINVRMDNISTVLFSGLFFAAMHGINQNFIVYIILGIIYSATYLEYRTIYITLTTHIINNTVTFFIVKYIE